MGSLGLNTTSAWSPASMKGTPSTFWLDVDLPIFQLMLVIWHGALAVRMWMEGVNPPLHTVSPVFLSFSCFPQLSLPGWSCTNTSAVNSAAALGGLGSTLISSMAITSPACGMFSLGSFLTLSPTLSPQPASCTDLWCISMEKMLPVQPVGEKRTLAPGEMAPCSTRPVITSPTPLILYTPDTGIRNAFLLCLGGFTTFSSASMSVCPLTFSFLILTVQPLNHGMLSLTWFRLSPLKPLIGMKGIFFVLYPIFVSILSTSPLISLYL